MRRLILAITIAVSVITTAFSKENKFSLGVTDGIDTEF